MNHAQGKNPFPPPDAAVAAGLDALAASIPAPDRAAYDAAKARQSILTKPAGSLGRLEELSCRIAGMQAKPLPSVEAGAIFVMAGDHGVCREGVSAYPPEVTAQMVLNFVRGGAAINVLAAKAGARVVVTDAGVDYAFDPGVPIHHEKIARGTRNFAAEPAMTRGQALASLAAGARVFEEEYSVGPIAIAATGDMGIGNTSASTAIAAVFTGSPVARLAGRGTGVDDAGLSRKIAVIEKALALHSPDPRDPVGALASVGGFEIGALAGMILAAASRRVPVLLDGYISGAAALLAAAIAPAAREYMIASHVSADSGHTFMLKALGLDPLLDLDMRLGEGTGAALAMMICSAACRTLCGMATFESAGISGK